MYQGIKLVVTRFSVNLLLIIIFNYGHGSMKHKLFGYLCWSRVDVSTAASLSRATSLSESLLSESLHEPITIVEVTAGLRPKRVTIHNIIFYCFVFVLT